MKCKSRTLVDDFVLVAILRVSLQDNSKLLIRIELNPLIIK